MEQNLRHLEHLVELQRETLPDWRFSLFEVLKHTDGVSTKTGKLEVLLGRSKPDYVVSFQHEDLWDAFKGAMEKAEELEKRNKK